MEWKDKGNAFFKAGNNSSAIQCYTKGLQGVKDGVMVDTSLIKVLYSNRSAAYVRYGKPEEALKDAEEALKLDPHWGKAYGRKGKALFDLAKYDLALETYEEGLAVDKMNGTLRAGIEECREAKKKAEEEDPLAAFMDDISALDASASGKAEEKTESKGEGEEEGADGKGGVDEKKQKYNVDHDAETRGWTKENQLKRLLQHQHKWLNLNPYFAFGLDPSANIDDIKRRYKKLNLLVHPDKNRDPLAEDAFQQVRVAYHKLKDPGERESALTLIKQTTDRVRKTRKRLLKKKGVTEDDLIAKDGTLEDAIAKEIKKEFATRGMVVNRRCVQNVFDT